MDRRGAVCPCNDTFPRPYKEGRADTRCDVWTSLEHFVLNDGSYTQTVRRCTIPFTRLSGAGKPIQTEGRLRGEGGGKGAWGGAVAWIRSFLWQR